MVVMNTGYKAGNMILLFLVNMLLTRMLGVSGFGALSLLIINVGIVNLVSGFGIDSSIIFYGASKKIPNKRILGILWSGIVIQLLLLLFTELFYLLISGKFLLINTFSFRRELSGVILVIALSIIEKYTALLNAGFRSVPAARIVFSTVFFLLLFLSGTYFFLPAYSSEVIIDTYIYAFLLQAFLLIIVYHKQGNVPFALQRPRFSEVKAFFTYSFTVFITNIIQFLAYRVDYWVIGYYHKEQVLGWYALAVKMGQFFWVLPLLLAALIFPAVSKNELSFENGKMAQLLRVINSFNIIAGILAITLAPILLPLLFGAAYSSSIRPFQQLLPGMLLFCNAIILAAYYAGKKKLKVNLLGSLICLLVILILDLLLIPNYSISGAVIANNIAYGITSIFFISYYLLEKKDGDKNIFLMSLNDLRAITFIFKPLKTEA